MPKLLITTIFALVLGIPSINCQLCKVNDAGGLAIQIRIGEGDGNGIPEDLDPDVEIWRGTLSSPMTQMTESSLLKFTTSGEYFIVETGPDFKHVGDNRKVNYTLDPLNFRCDADSENTLINVFVFLKAVNSHPPVFNVSSLSVDIKTPWSVSVPLNFDQVIHVTDEDYRTGGIDDLRLETTNPLFEAKVVANELVLVYAKQIDFNDSSITFDIIAHDEVTAPMFSTTLPVTVNIIGKENLLPPKFGYPYYLVSSNEPGPEYPLFITEVSAVDPEGVYNIIYTASKSSIRLEGGKLYFQDADSIPEEFPFIFEIEATEDTIADGTEAKSTKVAVIVNYPVEEVFKEEPYIERLVTLPKNINETITTITPLVATQIELVDHRFFGIRANNEIYAKQDLSEDDIFTLEPNGVYVLLLKAGKQRSTVAIYFELPLATTCPTVTTEIVADCTTELPSTAEMCTCPTDTTTQCPEPTPCATEPTSCPTETTACPTEPSDCTCPTEPTSCPTEPTSCPTEPTSCPTEPSSCTCPTEPTSCPTEPTSCPTEPTSCPTEPTSCPTEPTSCPTEPSSCTCPTEPTSCPTEPTQSTDRPTTDCPLTCPTEVTQSTACPTTECPTTCPTEATGTTDCATTCEPCSTDTTDRSTDCPPSTTPEACDCSNCTTGGPTQQTECPTTSLDIGPCPPTPPPGECDCSTGSTDTQTDSTQASTECPIVCPDPCVNCTTYSTGAPPDCPVTEPCNTDCRTESSDTSTTEVPGCSEDSQTGLIAGVIVTSLLFVGAAGAAGFLYFKIRKLTPDISDFNTLDKEEDFGLNRTNDAGKSVGNPLYESKSPFFSTSDKSPLVDSDYQEIPPTESSFSTSTAPSSSRRFSIPSIAATTAAPAASGVVNKAFTNEIGNYASKDPISRKSSLAPKDIPVDYENKEPKSSMAKPKEIPADYETKEPKSSLAKPKEIPADYETKEPKSSLAKPKEIPADYETKEPKSSMAKPKEIPADYETKEPKSSMAKPKEIPADYEYIEPKSSLAQPKEVPVDYEDKELKSSLAKPKEIPADYEGAPDVAPKEEVAPKPKKKAGVSFGVEEVITITDETPGDIDIPNADDAEISERL